MNPAEPDRGGQAAEKSAVRDDAALPPGDDVEHVIELVKVGRDVKEPCAGNRPEQRPRRAAIRQPSVYAGTLGGPNRQPTPGEHGHREHEPVRVDWNPERQVEKNGPHSMVLKRSGARRCTTLTRCSAKNQCTKLLGVRFVICALVYSCCSAKAQTCRRSAAIGSPAITS